MQINQTMISRTNVLDAKPNPSTKRPRPCRSDHHPGPDPDSDSDQAHMARMVKRQRIMSRSNSNVTVSNNNSGISSSSSNNFNAFEFDHHHRSPNVNIRGTADSHDEIEQQLSLGRAAQAARLRAWYARIVVKALEETSGLSRTTSSSSSSTFQARRFDELQVERDREAARLALIQVEKNVVIDDFNETYRQFLMLVSGRSN